MTIIQIVVILLVVGILLWLANTYVPMDGQIKKILNAVIVIVVVLWLVFMLLEFAGIGTGASLG